MGRTIPLSLAGLSDAAVVDRGTAAVCAEVRALRAVPGASPVYPDLAGRTALLFPQNLFRAAGGALLSIRILYHYLPLTAMESEAKAVSPR